MALDFTTFETTLQDGLDTVTNYKDMLLLGKAIESTIGNITISDLTLEGATQVSVITSQGTIQVGLIQAEGANQVSILQNAGSNYASLSGATFTGAVTATDLSSTGVLSANDVNASGNITVTGYLAGPSTFTIDPAAVGDNTGTVVIAGNLQVDGTTTTVNSTILEVADKNITLTAGASTSAEADGSGIEIDGANASILYTDATDSFDINKPIIGSYKQLHPVVTSTSASSTQTLDMNVPMNHVVMTAATAFSGINIAAGKTSMVVLDRAAAGYAPTWSTDIKWPDATEPTWTDYRYWVVSMTCLDGTTIFANASGYTV